MGILQAAKAPGAKGQPRTPKHTSPLIGFLVPTPCRGPAAKGAGSEDAQLCGDRHDYASVLGCRGVPKSRYSHPRIGSVSQRSVVLG